MKFLQRYSSYFFLLILLVCVFLLTQSVEINSDTWFHIASGKIISQLGIIHYDVFSYVTKGREWFPYEWLFQVGIFWYQKLFGLKAIGVLVGICATTLILIFYLGIKILFRLTNFATLLLSGMFFIFSYPYFIARPYVIVNIFFIFSLFIILLYILKKKNYLWLLIPVMLLWVNMHSSFIVLLFILFLYCGLSFIQIFLTRDKNAKNQAKTLTLFGGICWLVSLLPPVGIDQYRLLKLFLIDYRGTISTIIEWKPLIQSTVSICIFYSFFLGFVVILSLYIGYKKKLLRELVLLLPISLLAFTPYLAARNIFYGYFALMILCSWIFTKIKSRKVFYLFVLSLAIFGIIFTFTFIKGQNLNPTPIYPVKAADFILNENLQGNMFNNYGYGGYLLYRLYPKKKILIDGRTDLYICCELQTLGKLGPNPLTLSMDAFDAAFKETLGQYAISYVLVGNNSTLQIRETKYFIDHPKEWSLVFWDDNFQIFAKRNGLNDKVIKSFGAVAATPYQDSGPFDPKQLSRALGEYQKMIHISDSAVSRNAIGLMLLSLGRTQEAKENLEKGVGLRSNYFYVYANLATLEFQEKNYEKAKLYAQDMIQINPHEALGYKILGESYLSGDNDLVSARATWQEGLSAVNSPDGQRELQMLLNSLQ